MRSGVTISSRDVTWERGTQLCWDASAEEEGNREDDTGQDGYSSTGYMRGTDEAFFVPLKSTWRHGAESSMMTVRRRRSA